LSEHTVSTAHEMGWDRLDNGALLKAAEREFAAVITTDKNMRYQQSVTGRRIAIVVLPTTKWSIVRANQAQIALAMTSVRPGEYVELLF
jgi:hypothetical protein